MGRFEDDWMPFDIDGIRPNNMIYFNMNVVLIYWNTFNSCWRLSVQEYFYVNRPMSMARILTWDKTRTFLLIICSFWRALTWWLFNIRVNNSEIYFSSCLDWSQRRPGYWLFRPTTTDKELAYMNMYLKSVHEGGHTLKIYFNWECSMGHAISLKFITSKNKL